MSMPGRYQIVKKFGPELGLSSAYRQHRDTGHCRYIHGYCLTFEVTLEATKLDENNWVYPFGSFKTLKDVLVSQFDHKLLVAKDDPAYALLLALHQEGVAQITWVEAVGAEAFANFVFHEMQKILESLNYHDRVKVISVTCSERDGNSAVYIGAQE